MRCGVHVCVEMELLEIAAPGWLVSPDGAGETADGRARTMGKRHLRKYWKCPAPGCTRVAAFDWSADSPERPACRKCGGPTDMDAIQLRTRNGSCRNCYNAKYRARRDSPAKRLAQHAAPLQTEAVA